MTVVYRRERKDMPAIPEETEAAEHEGVQFLFLATPHRIVGDKQGAVKAIEVVKTKLGEFDTSGRRRPVPTDEVVRVDCDTVILAVGETVDPDFARASGLKVKEAGTLEVDRYSLETSRERFYAGGDLITGASNVSNAMGYGKKAARNIDERLMGAKRFTVPLARLRVRDGAAREARARAARTCPARCAAATRVQVERRGLARPDARRPRGRRRPAACGATSAASTAEGGPGVTQKLKVRIDGELVAASPGQTVLQVARASGKYIPALCHMEGLTAGRRVPPLHRRGRRGVRASCPACTTPVAGRPGRHDHLAAARLPTARSRSSCSSASATTSARSACRTATASCRRWRRSSG